MAVPWCWWDRRPAGPDRRDAGPTARPIFPRFAPPAPARATFPEDRAPARPIPLVTPPLSAYHASLCPVAKAAPVPVSAEWAHDEIHPRPRPPLRAARPVRPRPGRLPPVPDPAERPGARRQGDAAGRAGQAPVPRRPVRLPLRLRDPAQPAPLQGAGPDARAGLQGAAPARLGPRGLRLPLRGPGALREVHAGQAPRPAQAPRLLPRPAAAARRHGRPAGLHL